MATTPNRAPSFFNFLRRASSCRAATGLFTEVFTIILLSIALLALRNDLSVKPLADEIKPNIQALNTTEPSSPDLNKLPQELKYGTMELLLVSDLSELLFLSARGGEVVNGGCRWVGDAVVMAINSFDLCSSPTS
jgi:hypothetical protein